MPGLRVLLLGPPQVELDGHPLSIRRRVTRALLFYLASRGGTVGRDELLTLFWENEPESVARSRLREVLSRLRSELGDPELLVTDLTLVGLDFTRLAVDQIEFQELIDQAGRVPWQIPPETPLPAGTYQLLRQAIGLWRSPRFLAGADLPSTPGLDDWLTNTRQHLEHLHGHVLERLADHADAIGDLEQAMNFARLALSNDNLNEDLHYRILHSLVRMGRHSEGREYFNYLQGLLRRELDTGPSPRLVDLYRQIREAERPSSAPSGQPLWNLRPTIKAPYVGQEHAFRQLHEALRRGGGVVILGESGQGKTRLLQEFARQVRPQPRLLLAVCRPVENNLPFQAIIELLRHHIRPDEWLALAPTWINQLALLLPELHSMAPRPERALPEFAPDAPAARARALLMEAIRQVFLLISQSQALLFYMDDAQWADEASLATLAYLLERPPFDRKALLVVTARQEELPPHLEKLLQSLQHSTRARILHLSHLNPDEISILTQHVLNRTPPRHFLQQLANESGGNPLFILETMRAVLERGVQPVLTQMDSLPMAPSLQALIHARLAQLSGPARQVLEIAAVIGTEFDPEIVAQLGRSTRQKVVEALEELEQRLLIEAVGNSPQDVRHSFIHDKIREVLVSEINPLRARMLHEEVARLLKSRLSSDGLGQAAVLARHFEAAGKATQAFEYWVHAGRHARQLFSVGEALHAFSRAERLIPQAVLTNEQLHTLYSEWSEAAFEIEDVATVRRLNTELLHLGHMRSSPLLTGAALDGLSDACLALNQFTEGLHLTNQALPFLEQSGNLYRYMEAYNHRGVFLYMLNRIEESIASFQDALAVGTDAHDELILRARANAHYQLSVARTLNGWPETGLSHATRALANAVTANRAHGQVTAYSALAFARYFLGDYPQAYKDCQTGIELAERLQAWRMLGYLHAYQAMIALAMGDFDAAVEQATQGIELGERYGHNEIAAGGYRIIGDAFYRLLAYDQAIAQYERGLQAGSESLLNPDIQFRLGVALCRVGQVEIGQDHLNQAIKVAQLSGLGIVVVKAQIAQATALLWQEKWEQASLLAAQVERETQRRGMKANRLSAATLVGRIALELEGPEKAAAILEWVSREAVALHTPWVELLAQSGLVLALRQAGRETDVIHRRRSELMEQIIARTRSPILQPAVEEFRQKLGL